MGVLRLDAETKKEIERGPLTLVATIPKRNLTLRPHPNLRQRSGKGGTGYPYGIVLGINREGKTTDRKEVLTALNTLKHWQTTLCPEATINEEALILEITGRTAEGQYFTKAESEEEWQAIILREWGWVDSPRGTQGLLFKEDHARISSLKGSRKYNRSSRQIALKLFRAFAQEWEDKNNLVPPYAKKWWYNKQREPEEEIPNTEEPTEDELQRRSRKHELLAQQAERSRENIDRSGALLQQAMTTLLEGIKGRTPSSTSPRLGGK